MTSMAMFSHKICVMIPKPAVTKTLNFKPSSLTKALAGTGDSWKHAKSCIGTYYYSKHYTKQNRDIPVVHLDE